MSQSASTTWTDPSTCPFCDAELADPGAGFVDHIHTSTECKSEFDTWRSNIAGDMGGEWSG
ncbi:DUF7501 family protein [Natranaeroarchaeum aerophilus]|uniref:Uncharacterized protein n=1 Tax=Natranaeroarchaeum aerophilus TaxID=2917711 RepID=A0AAE3FQP3_9EURY|nr:hypothetical protein [Natranaeroarchaeum aerophilus]MCL9813548.1 hypothetical protein [Natranaeroarchaeum aerophilus]